MEPPRRIWIIGAERWPRAYLRAELIERGYDAVGFVTTKDALVRLRLARSSRPDVIVLDLREQLLGDEVAAALFRERIPVVAIAGAAQLEDPRLRALPWRALLRRPLTLGAVADAVARVAPSHCLDVSRDA